MRRKKTKVELYLAVNYPQGPAHLTCALPLLGRLLVDVEDSRNLQLHGVKVRANQGPQLERARLTGLHQLRRNLLLVTYVKKKKSLTQKLNNKNEHMHIYLYVMSTHTS